MRHLLTMVMLQLGYAAMNIILKLAMDSDMNPFVHVAYRQLFATVAIALPAYFLERDTRPRMTRSIFFKILLCSIFGITINHITYLVGLKNSSPTTASALSNLVPAFTFIITILFGRETFTLWSAAGRFKFIGTIICVGGAMLLIFYHGHNIIGESGIHWLDSFESKNKNDSNNNFILGSFLNIISTSSWAIWSIIQERVSKEYEAPYSSTALMCLLSSIQCVVIAIAFDHKLSDWSLRQGIRAISVVYSGVFGSAVAYCLMTWCIRQKGPLYVSAFNPLVIVFVDIFSWALLRNKIYVGTVVGTALITVGLYAVIWGKKIQAPQATDRGFQGP